MPFSQSMPKFEPNCFIISAIDLKGEAGGDFWYNDMIEHDLFLIEVAKNLGIDIWGAEFEDELWERPLNF